MGAIVPEEEKKEEKDVSQLCKRERWGWLERTIGCRTNKSSKDARDLCIKLDVLGHFLSKKQYRLNHSCFKSIKWYIRTASYYVYKSGDALSVDGSVKIAKKKKF